MSKPQTTQVPEKIHNLNKTEGYPDGGPTVEIKGDGKYMTATPQTTKQAYKKGFEDGANRMKELILKDISWLKSQYKVKEEK